MENSQGLIIQKGEYISHESFTRSLVLPAKIHFLMKQYPF